MFKNLSKSGIRSHLAHVKARTENVVSEQKVNRKTSNDDLFYIECQGLVGKGQPESMLPRESSHGNFPASSVCKH